MILDTLEHAGIWKLCNDNIIFALGWLGDPKNTGLDPGMYEIRGRDIYASIAEYMTRPAEHCRLETHRNYIDVQYVARGIERMGYSPSAGLEPDGPYDEARDVQFYRGSADFALLREGMFAILFPDDGHMPGVAVEGLPGAVKKIVVKVKIKDY